jgi:antitoxin component HigA of HigAB toxin-antitoxin module
MTKKIELKNVDEIFTEFLSKDEIAAADAEADAEMKVLKALLEDVSAFATGVMAEEGLGFRAFARKHGLSLSMASKIVKGSGNLTLETIAHIAAQHGRRVSLSFAPVED